MDMPMKLKGEVNCFRPGQRCVHRPFILRRSLDLLLPIIIILFSGYLLTRIYTAGSIARVLQLNAINESFRGKKKHILKPVALVLNTTPSVPNTFLLSNITKIPFTQKLFLEIPEESYLNTSFFKAAVINKHNYSYEILVHNESMCSPSGPYILILIPSEIKHLEIREAIRKTWLKAAETNSWPNFKVRQSIKHAFLFGYRTNSYHEDMAQLSIEANKHGDLVMGSFVDSYRNLTLKMLNGLSWAVRYCSGIQYVLKVDEDTMVNAPLMVELLIDVQKRKGKEKVVVGLQHAHAKPVVVRDGQWAVSKEEYPLDYFPKYVYGHTYALSRSALDAILHTAKRVTIISPEDAYITGIIPKFAGIHRLHAPSFTVCCRIIFDCEIVYNYHVAMTTLSSAERLNKLWKSVALQTCDTENPF